MNRQLDDSERDELREAIAERIWTDVDGPLGKGSYPEKVTGHELQRLRADAALDAIRDAGYTVGK